MHTLRATLERYRTMRWLLETDHNWTTWLQRTHLEQRPNDTAQCADCRRRSSLALRNATRNQEQRSTMHQTGRTPTQLWLIHIVATLTTFCTPVDRSLCAANCRGGSSAFYNATRMQAQRSTMHHVFYIYSFLCFFSQLVAFWQVAFCHILCHQGLCGCSAHICNVGKQSLRLLLDS